MHNFISLKCVVNCARAMTTYKILPWVMTNSKFELFYSAYVDWPYGYHDYMRLSGREVDESLDSINKKLSLYEPLHSPS